MNYRDAKRETHYFNIRTEAEKHAIKISINT